MSDLFHVEVTKFEGYVIESLTVKKTVQGKQVEEIDEAKLRQRVYTTPIEEVIWLSLKAPCVIVGDRDICDGRLSHQQCAQETRAGRDQGDAERITALSERS